MTRAFIALELPEHVREELSSTLAILSRKAAGYKFVRPEAMHLTLKFLGEVAPELFSRVAGIIEGGIPCGGPIELFADGVGGFPDLRRARVLWVGLGGETGRLGVLFRALEEALEPVGIPAERRPFSPHLTLGRLRDAEKGGGLENAVERLGDRPGNPWTATEIVLYESILRPTGAVHLARARGPLTV